MYLCGTLIFCFISDEFVTVACRDTKFVILMNDKIKLYCGPLCCLPCEICLLFFFFLQPILGGGMQSPHFDDVHLAFAALQ